MVSIQKRASHGHTYWYIVESRRVDGKPRPVTLAYLGKPETLLARLTSQQNFVLKSYSHGDTAALLNIAIELDLITFINQFITPGPSQVKQQRHHLTVGAFLLAAIGRACQPTSKLGWYDWAQRNLHHFLNDLRSIRLASITRSPPEGRGRLKVDFQLEKISPDLQKIAEVLGITNQNLRPNIELGVYK